MKRKQLYRFICIITLFILSLFVFSQDKAVKKNDQGFDEKFWVPIIIGLAGFAFGLYQQTMRLALFLSPLLKKGQSSIIIIL